MNSFKERYTALNSAQKQAVDTLDGPVMVVAGPGTGKTELLSVRVANILKRTDALPSNVLCLTFTESGAIAMRERLAGLIGADAYKVAIHTFHSFGAEIINRYSEYFYNGAHFRPADELSSYELLKEIFDGLPHDDVLANRMNDEYTYLRDTQSAISDLKKSGLTSDELTAILDRNERFMTWFQPRLNSVFSERLSKKLFGSISSLLSDISAYSEEEYDLITYEPLWKLVLGTLEQALEASETENSTKPLTAWKKDWCEKRPDGEITLKDEKRSSRLRSVSKVYYKYLVAMQQNSLYDFDDMILRTVHALEVFDDLRLNLQELYQYVLVDEFQDTNDAQMRLLWNLTNNPVNGGRPNVMVVGDDDQAIYRFQGANLSNILDFKDLYTDVSVVTLTENYRSAPVILDAARQTVVRTRERLETTMSEVDKTLNAHFKPQGAVVELTAFPDDAAEYDAVARQIAEYRTQNPGASIAVISRHHRQLEALVPSLRQQAVPLSYDRQTNALDSPAVLLLERMAQTVMAFAEQNHSDANARLAELLAHPAWGISTEDLWKLSLNAHANKQQWLSVMLEHEGPLSDIALWLLETTRMALYEPLEYLLDRLTGCDQNQLPDSGDEEVSNEGTNTTPKSFRSPLKDYYFSPEALSVSPAEYVLYLEALSRLRHHVRDYRPSEVVGLADFVHLLSMYRALGVTISAGSHTTDEHSPVELLTAHRSKGLEFDAVFVIGLADNRWGETTRAHRKLISYPHNLPIGIVGDESDEHIRLLYVALTRSRSHLFLSLGKISETGKTQLPVGYLEHLQLQESEHTAPVPTRLQNAAHGPNSEAEESLKTLLSDRLASYKLSATHLTNYLDITRGGPEMFLMQNLLRFPQTMSPSAAYGSSVHVALQRAHTHLTSNGKRKPVEDILGDFEVTLRDHHLSRTDHEYFAKKGSDSLSQFFHERYDTFTPEQQVEQQFTSETVMVGNARLTGAIDLLDIDEKTKSIVVTDYKTGKCASTWSGRTEYERIKLHHYRHQLMFYKLLIENSRRYSGYTVSRGVIEFIEPDSDGTIKRLELEYDAAELSEFEKLIGAVWKHIIDFDFKARAEYEPKLSGILSFEADLLA